jgi:hypothetical protein
MLRDCLLEVRGLRKWSQLFKRISLRPQPLKGDKTRNLTCMYWRIWSGVDSATCGRPFPAGVFHFFLPFRGSTAAACPCCRSGGECKCCKCGPNANSPALYAHRQPTGLKHENQRRNGPRTRTGNAAIARNRKRPHGSERTKQIMPLRERD